MADAIITTDPWYQGADATISGHIKNMGLDQKPVNEAALAAVKSHFELQQKLGIPADQIVRWPKDPSDEANWKTVRARLGVPADPKEYDFTGLKLGTEEVDASFTDAMRAAAAKHFLPKETAKGVAEEVLKYLNAAETEEKATSTAAISAEKAKLDLNWGANKDAHLLVARNAARALGFPPETVQALENVVGYAAIMEMFRTIGSKIGEDSFVRSGPGNTGVMTREQAIATLKERKADKGWGEKLMKGDSATVREFQALTTLISPVGDDTASSHRSLGYRRIS